MLGGGEVGNLPGRLIIHTIVVENFKSYAGKQEIGPFDKSFTSIVGPNGSGKSNVIDAIMFVLGYRAKKMRQTKLSDLIHVSDGMAELESCSVQVHFRRIIDGEGEVYQWVPEYSGAIGGEITVSRVAYRNNRNVYLLNGASSNYHEITSLLKTQGIDLDHKRFLILQGEVEAIAMMKPKGSTEHEEGLLEYLEDIVGTNQYISAIEAAAKELDLINELHAEKFLRVKAAEKECQALRGEKEEAESYLRQENTRTERKNELLQASIWKAQNDIKALSERIAGKKSELQEERAANSSDAAVADELEVTLKMATRDAAELEKQSKAFKAELSALEQNDLKLQETRKHLKNKLKNLTKQSSDSAKQEADLQRSIEDTTSTMERLERDLTDRRTDLEASKAELEGIGSSLKNVTERYQKALDTKQAELAPFQDQMRSLQQEMDLAQSALRTLEEKSTEGQRAQEKLSQRLGEIEGQMAESKARKATLTTQIATITDQAQSGREKLARLEEERAAASKTIQILQSTAAEAIAAMQQGENGGNAVHKALSKEAKSGRIRGFHGRLGDLGAIDKKYDVAIATACAFLDHIVVETTEVGQHCIEFLRRNNAGRANFIVMNKMRAAARTLPRDTPTGSRRLFDLVKLQDDRYTDVMYFALNDTLVAESLEQAQAWAYGARRWRVVTLDGKLFEVSGTISGGGQVRRGGMGSAVKDASNEVSPEQVAQLQEKCREAQEHLKMLVHSISREQMLQAGKEDELMKLEAELAVLESLSRTLSTEKEMVKASLSTACSKQSSLSPVEEGELKSLESTIKTLHPQMQTLKNRMRPIEEKVAEIQQQIMDAGGIKYKVQFSKVQGLQDQIDNSDRRFADLAKEKALLECKLTALRNGQRDETAINRVEVELKDLDAKITKSTETAIALQQDFTNLQRQLDERHEQVEALQERLDKVSRSVGRFKKVEYELRCAIEADEEALLKAKRVQDSSQTQLTELRLHHVDPKQPAPVLASYETDEEELAEFSRNLVNLQQTIDGITQRLERLHPNLKVLEEYRRKEANLEDLQSQLSAAECQKEQTRRQYDELCRRRHDEFMSGFRAISARLKELYQLITMGGNAELELVDSLDPFSEGVLFSVMPPRKSWKVISNLSGGEKTLSSLALVFALHTYRPTPIYIMDEIDAALDFRNVSIIAHYIKERTKDTQFIVISLRNNMFELADRLVGIYKTWQRTKSIAIDPRQYHMGSGAAGLAPEGAA